MMHYVLMGGLAAVALCLPVRDAAAQGAREHPATAQRLTRWASARSGQPIPALVSFGQLLADGQAEQLLKRHGVRGFAVYARAAGLTLTHRVRPEAASDGIIAAARQAFSAHLAEVVAAQAARRPRFAQRFSMDSLGNPSNLALARSTLRVFEHQQQSLSATRGTQPIVFAVEVLGTPAALQALAGDPLVVAFEPADIVQGAVQRPLPRLPSSLRGQPSVPAVDTLGPASVNARFRALNEGRRGE